MNDDLQKALAEILNKTTQGVEAGVGFLQRELPDVVQQLLIWHGIRSAFYFLIAVVVSGALAKIAFTLWDAGKAYTTKNLWDEGKGWRFFGAAVSGVFALLTGFIAINTLAWLQILLAPKLYLIEYAASLVK